MANLQSLGSFEDTALGQMAIEKAKELFSVCDSETKGFIIKRDMQRLKKELPGLTPEQLEEVFDSLDQDHNGFLTMEEFVKGFGAFLGLQIPEDGPEPEKASLGAELHQAGYSKRVPTQDSVDDEEAAEKEQFNRLMDEIGATSVFRDQAAAQDLWQKLRKDDPELLTNFEEFLSNVSGELKKTQEDFSSLETAMHQRNTTHDDEIRRLYEEMEAQIRAEKERVANEERLKAERLKEEMEREIISKDQQLQEILKKQSDLESKLEDLDFTKSTTKQENEILQQEREAFARQKEAMESDLERTTGALEETKLQLDQMRRQTREERRARAQASFKVTEGIASERETLVKQLDNLRTMNKQLKDERDAMGPSGLQPPGGATKKSSVVGNYLEDEERRNLAAARAHSQILNAEESIEEDEEEFHPHHTNTAILPDFGGPGNSLAAEMAGAMRTDSQESPEFDASKPRSDPVGGNEADDHDSLDSLTPERIFKVVFVGDSGVGKTCFLHRFCHNRFKPTFSATIGVDFQVKSIKVEDKLVALQLWDTAGQERFRSITKQYFRKADGVILMYDVTSEQSFLNIRNWMSSVKEGVDKDCVLCMVGNKIDLCQSESERNITYKDGQKLADESSTLFYETSAQTGVGISECMQAMAILLREREDQHLENALKLEMDVTKKKKCCGRG